MDTEGSSGGEIFQHPVAQPQPVVSIPPCSSLYYKFKQHKCPHCSFRSNHRHVVTRHAESKHNEKKKKKAVIREQPPPPPPPPPSIDSGGGGGGGGDTTDDDDDDDEVGEQFNVQLEPDFKIFLAGPSKSGKTNFCSQLLANLSTIAKSKPATTIYVYATWQSKLKEMKQQGLVDIFLHGGHDLEERLKRAQVTSPRPTLIIFDDMMMEKSTLPYIAKLFAIGRHSKLSLIFITQKIFIDDDSLRVIRENSDYYVLMKNPTNVRSVSQLVGRLNPNPSLVSNIFLNATHNKPYSYLFCNVTQGATLQTQYLSELFERDHIVTSYVIESNMNRKKTTFHKMYLVSAEKLEKVRRRTIDDPNLGCSKPPSPPEEEVMEEEEKEEEEMVPPSPPPPPVEQPAAAAAAAAVELPRRDIGAGLDANDYPPIPVVDPDLDKEEDEVMAEVVEKEEEEEETTKCTQCGHSFKNAKGLKIHTKKKHPLAIVKKNVSFKKRVHPAAVQELKIKKSGRHAAAGGHCYCKICYEEFTSRQAYDKHVEEKHLAGWKVDLNKMDDDDDGEITLSDLDNPMEDEEEISVEKRLESNKKKAKLNRKILSKYKQQRQPKRIVVVEKKAKKKKKKKKKAAKKDDDDSESCRHCQKRFTSASELKDHFIAEHQK